MTPDSASEQVFRHELRRFEIVAPVLVPLLVLTGTIAALVSGLRGWAWNLLALPAVIIPAAAMSFLAEVVVVPRLTRRFEALPAVPVMAVTRLVLAAGTAGLVTLALGHWLVAAGVWWSWFPVWTPLAVAVVGVVGAVAVALYDRIYFRLQDSFAELERRRSLERFLPREAVDRVMAGDDLAVGGERRVVTVLFADLRDSTAIGETLSAPEVVGFLNQYVGAMARAVFANGGMIDKFLGDGLMAVFGIMPSAADGAEAAVRAALDIRGRFDELNALRSAQGQPPVGHGVGIHTGEVVLGAVGIAERSDYTAVGDTVNTASRLEALTKNYGDIDVVLSADSVRRLPEGFCETRSLGEVAIRGRSGTVEIFGLVNRD